MNMNNKNEPKHFNDLSKLPLDMLMDKLKKSTTHRGKILNYKTNNQKYVYEKALNLQTVLKKFGRKQLAMNAKEML